MDARFKLSSITGYIDKKHTQTTRETIIMIHAAVVSHALRFRTLNNEVLTLTSVKVEEVQELTRRINQFDTETGVARLFTIVAEQIIQQHPDLKSLDSDDAVLESTKLCTLWETVKKGLSAEGVRARSSLRVEPEMSRSQDPKRLSEAGLNTSLTASDLNGPSVQPDGATYHAADRDPSVIAEDEPQSREDFHLSHGLQQYTRCMHHGCGKCAKGEHRVAFT